MNKLLSFFITGLLFIGLSCEEIPPVLNPAGGGGGSGSVENQPRQVLIEEFTGVRCVNCPAGSEAIQAIVDAYDGRAIAVGIHAGFFAVPYPESNENLAVPTGASLLSLLGEPIGYPTAVINRRHFDGEENRQTGQGTWAGYVAEELATDPLVKIDIQPTFDATSRELTINTGLYVQENITFEDVRVTVYLTEDNIQDPQLTPDGVNYDYNHKHVFRAAASAFDGDQLTESLTAGAVINRTFSLTLADHWKENDCHVVVFVHRGGAILDVIQAHEVAVLE
ncbi:MAG: Omp28-related outer membrane protein [Saprospiraceae bacterium]